MPLSQVLPLDISGVNSKPLATKKNSLLKKLTLFSFVLGVGMNGIATEHLKTQSQEREHMLGQ